MSRPIAHHAIAAAALLLTLFAPWRIVHADTTRPSEETTWSKIVLDGRKIGHMRTTRQVVDGQVRTVEDMSMAIDRGGIVLEMQTQNRSVERPDGTPIAFGARLVMTGLTTDIEGTVRADGKADVVLRSAGREEKRVIDWPAGAILAEGADLASRRHGLKPGTHYRLMAFEPMELRGLEVEVRVNGPTEVSVDGETLRLTEVEQRALLGESALSMRSWVDESYTVRKFAMPILGLELEIIACNEACATAPNQAPDLLERTVVKAPAVLDRAVRTQGVRYRVSVLGADDAPMPNTAEQRSRPDGKQWVVEVDPTPAYADRRAPRDSERRANRWLESDDPEIIGQARAHTRAIEGAAAKMQALERFVDAHIHNKSLRVGYASALETLRAQEGDCTEHAVLLAALGRAIGIPTRVVNGLAYAEAFAGHERVFVPHAWVQAWVDGRWRSYDAALKGFDGGHIALGTSDGDASGFYAAVSLLGNLDVHAADALEATP
jgi:hypothetical protein